MNIVLLLWFLFTKMMIVRNALKLVTTSPVLLENKIIIIVLVILTLTVTMSYFSSDGRQVLYLRVAGI